MRTVHQINSLAASQNNLSCVLNVIDGTNHMSDKGKKDAVYISNSMLSLMNTIDPNKMLLNAIAFDGSSKVQIAGNIMAQHFSWVTVIHGAEHVVSIIFEAIVKITPFKQYSYSCKMVSRLTIFLHGNCFFLH